MKFTFNIDIAIIITAFTTFLFWCGYWYNYGYANFFGLPISFFELNLATTLIDGILVAPDKFLTVLLFTLLISFFSHYTQKDAEFCTGCIGSTLGFLFFLTKFLISPKNKKNKYFPITNPLTSCVPFKTNYILKKKKGHSYFSNRESIKFSIKKLQEHNMTYKQVATSAYGHNVKTYGEKTVIRIAVYYVVIFTIITIFIGLFNTAQNLQYDGYNKAELNFQLNFTQSPSNKKEYTVFPLIKSHGDPLNTFRLTNICNKESCFAVDAKKNVKLVAFKEITIINNLDKKAS